MSMASAPESMWRMMPALSMTKVVRRAIPLSSSNTPYRRLSDFEKSLSRLYGVLDEERGMARRTTFVIDKAGIIRHIDSGRDAIDIAGVKAACGQLQ